MKFKTTYNQYIPKSTTKTLRTGAGEVHAIIITSTATSAELVLNCFNIAGNGNKHLELYTRNISPINIYLPPYIPFQFFASLTVIPYNNHFFFVYQPSHHFSLLK